MLEEAHRAARTIDDLMELSRIELGGEHVRGGVDTGDIIRAAVERVAEIAHRREITIDWLDPDQSVTVTGDQRQLVSAVGNLVENAVKYSEIGGLVQIRSRVVGPWIEFMITDQGSASRAAISTGSSSASTASTRRAAATPAGRASACRSCATSRPTTAATSRCRRAKARAARSCCASRPPPPASIRRRGVHHEG